VPTDTVVPPSYVFAPLSFSVPPPVLVRPKPVAAEMTPESSVVAVLSVSSVRDS
jgi:hypothetical protein